MIIIMERGSTEEQVEGVIEKLVDLGFSVHRSTGAVHTVLGAVGPNEDFDAAEFAVLPGVKECHRVIAPYKRTGPKIGRNDPCPCGSGKKHKKCCGG